MPNNHAEQVRLIAGLVNGERLAAEHVDGGNGRCRCCHVGGDSSAGEIWPCDGWRMAQRVIAEQQRCR